MNDEAPTYDEIVRLFRSLSKDYRMEVPITEWVDKTLVATYQPGDDVESFLQQAFQSKPRGVKE